MQYINWVKFDWMLHRTNVSHHKRLSNDSYNIGVSENLPGRFQLEKIDEKQFLKSLEEQKDLIGTFLSVAKSKPPGTNKCKQALDKCAKNISAYIYTNLELTTPQSKNSGQGEPWWDDNYRDVVRDMRQIQQHQAFDASLSINNITVSLVLSPSRTKVQKTVKKAKREYYQKVNRELDHKSIFCTVKWSLNTRQ